MDNLELNIDFNINNPELRVAAEKAKAEIQGVANTAEQAQKRVQQNLNNAVNPQNATQSTAAQTGILEGLKKKIEEAKRIANEATSETTIEIANAKIQQYENQIKRLSVIGKQGFDDFGNAIADAVEKPIGKIEKLKHVLGKYKEMVNTSNNDDIIAKYNEKIQDTESQIESLTNIGKEGFDELGEKIGKSGGFVGKLWGGLSKVANIIPGIGIAGLFALALEPLIQYIKTLDFLKKELVETELRAKAISKALEGGGEYAKAVSNVAELRVEMELVGEKGFSKTAVIEKYNETIGRTAGQVKTLEEAEKGLAKNAESYVKMTLYKAAAENILQEAGEKAALAAKERNKTDKESVPYILSGTSGLDDGKGNDFYKKAGKAAREKAAKVIEEEAKPLEQIAKELLKKASEEAQKMGGLLGLDKSTKDNSTNTAIDAAASLQQKVFEINEEYARKSKTKDEEELQALRDKFLRISEEVEKFNKNPKNKVKVDGSGLEKTKIKAIDDLTFRQDTEKLKISLDTQKGLWEQYENYKKEFGEERAKERFGKELDLSKSYLSVVEGEYNKLASKNGTSLTGAEKERLDALKKLLDVAKVERMKTDDENFKTALEASKTYNDKLIEIQKDFQKKRNELAKNKADSPEKLLELDKAEKLAVDAAKDEALQKTAIYQKLAYDTIEMTRTQVEAQLKVLKELLKNANIPEDIRKAIEGDVQALEISLKIGVEQSNLDNLKERLAGLTQELSSTDSEGKSIVSEKERKRILGAIAEIQNKIKGIDTTGNGKVTYADKLAKNFEYLKGTSQEVADGLAKDMGRLGSSFSSASNALGGVNTEIGYLLGQLGSVLEVGSQAAASFASFSSGDIIGGISGALGALSGLYNMINGNEQKRQEAIQNAIKGEQQYQDLLRQRALDTVKLNKTTLEGIQAEIRLRKEQQAQIQKDSDELLKNIQNYSIVGLKLLKGKSTAELEELLLKGVFDNQLKIYVERLIELQKQGIDTEVALRDLANQLNEIFTGTTADSLTNGLLDMFKEGKTSVQDFADFFEQAMKDAALSIFKNKILADAMDKFYQEFTKATQDGNLDASKIANLKLLFESLVSGANTQFQALQQVTGLTLGGAATGSGSSSLSGQIQRNITEATGSELAGLFRSQYDISKKSFGVQSNTLDVVKQQATTLLAIERNTYNTVGELQNVTGELKKIRTYANISFDRGL